MQVTVEIPDQFLDSLIPAGADPARTLFEQSVAAAYRDGRIGPRSIGLLLGFETRMQVDDSSTNIKSAVIPQKSWRRTWPSVMDQIRVRP